MKEKKKILFICTGNICRSPLAHRLFEKIAQDKGVSHLFEVESAGTGAYHVGQNADPRMRETAAQKGLELNHHANHLQKNDIEYYDYLIVMDESHYYHCKRIAPADEHITKIKYLREFDEINSGEMDVPDPYYGGQAGFNDVYEICERSCNALLDYLLK